MQVIAVRGRRRPAVALALAGALAVAAAPALGAGALERIKASGRVTFGYGLDAAPYASADASGNPSGYAIALCTKIGEALKSELKMPALVVTFASTPREDSIAALGQGKFDILCGAVPTLERRAVADFSIPIIMSGTGVAVRKDAPVRVMQALSGNPPKSQATWRGSTDQAPQRGVIAVIGNTVLESGLADRLKQRHINVSIVTVKDAAAGMQLLADRNTDAFFADRALLLEALAHARSQADIRVLDPLYRRDLGALAVQRPDDDLRLLVDRTLSHLYRSKEIYTIYSNYFGAPTPEQQDFFQLMAIPD